MWRGLRDVGDVVATAKIGAYHHGKGYYSQRNEGSRRKMSRLTGLKFIPLSRKPHYVVKVKIR